MSTKMAVSQPWHFVSRGKLPKIRVNTSGKETYLHTWSEQPCLQSGTTQDGLLGKAHTWHQGCQDIYQKIQKGGVHHFQGTTEAGSRPQLRSRPPHSRVLLHIMLISLALAAGGAALLPTWLQRAFPTRLWWLPCPPCCLPDLWTETLGLGFVTRIVCCMCVLYFS